MERAGKPRDLCLGRIPWCRHQAQSGRSPGLRIGPAMAHLELLVCAGRFDPSQQSDLALSPIPSGALAYRTAVYLDWRGNDSEAPARCWPAPLADPSVLRTNRESAVLRSAVRPAEPGVNRRVGKTGQ